MALLHLFCVMGSAAHVNFSCFLLPKMLISVAALHSWLLLCCCAANQNGAGAALCSLQTLPAPWISVALPSLTGLPGCSSFFFFLFFFSWCEASQVFKDFFFSYTFIQKCKILEKKEPLGPANALLSNFSLEPHWWTLHSLTLLITGKIFPASTLHFFMII